MIKVESVISEEFCTHAGMRQGCTLRTTLFPIYNNKMEEELGNGRLGRVKIGNEKLWSLVHADDVVLMAGSREDIEEIMRRQRRFLKKRCLGVNVEKSKILIFGKAKENRKDKVVAAGGKRN